MRSYRTERNAAPMIEQLFTASIDSIITTDINGIINELNPKAEIMFGYSREEFIGMHVKELYASAEEFEKVFTIISKEGIFKGEIHNKAKSGHIIHSFLSASCMLDEKGDFIGMMGVSRDITADISLQKEYKQLVDTVSDIIYSTDVNGKFTFVNESVINVLGYEAQELINTTFESQIFPPHQERVRDHYRSLFEKRLPQSYLEFQVVRKDGSLIWVGQQVSTRFNAQDKNVIDGYYGVVRNIDPRKKNELLLAESEEKYRELFDTSSDLIQSVDVNGNFLYVNKSWRNVLGYSQKEIQRLSMFSLIHPDSREHCEALFANIRESGGCDETRILYDLIDKRGQKITVEGAINVKLIEGEIQSIQSFLRDVTQQKEAEKLLAKQERTLRQITETLNDVFYLYNIIEKKYEYISSNCEAILNADDAFFYAGKSHTKTYGHPDDRGILLDANKRVDNGEAYDIDYRLIVNEETRWINEKSFPIRDEQGNVIANSGICRDVTDLKSANETIYRQNIKIGSSILYAKRLQDSVLPTDNQFLTIFPDSFVMYRPKDVVSGDFYLVDYLRNNNHESLPAIIVADCTGHGVPGAVLSLMCNVLVRESFTRHEINSPSEALDFVRDRLASTFGANKESTIRDGMDISFCVHNPRTNQLYFSGANGCCVIIRNGELTEYKGDKQHVGFTDAPEPFSNHVIDVKLDDLVFLYTDGYADQFGGPRDKKFSKKRLYELFVSASQLPMADAGALLETEFIHWKQEKEQIDDVTVLGIRIT